MLTVISPAKTLDYDTPIKTATHSIPCYLDESKRLIDVLRKKSSKDLGRLMGISKKLADLNRDRYCQWRRDLSPSDAGQAAMVFMGDVYVGLDARSLSARDLTFAQKRLRILSGLYGLLRPLDLMQPYRLEMGTALKTPRGSDLYSFWGDTLAESLNQQARTLRTRYLVNLASNEYFKSVSTPALDLEIVTPVFKDLNRGTYRVISFFAKKARGLMARHIIEHRVKTIAGLREFDAAGYAFNAALSADKELVFTRDSKPE